MHRLERLGRYELLEELGRGAMGVVYKARDPEIDRLVAVKVLATAPGLDPGEARQHRERFQREARAAGRLAHPNIVTIHDVGEDQGRTFLVMQLVEGRRVVRGGSWYLNPWDLHSSNREFGAPGYRSVYIRFRCAQG